MLHDVRPLSPRVNCSFEYRKKSFSKIHFRPAKSETRALKSQALTVRHIFQDVHTPHFGFLTLKCKNAHTLMKTNERAAQYFLLSGWTDLFI